MTSVKTKTVETTVVTTSLEELKKQDDKLIGFAKQYRRATTVMAKQFRAYITAIGPSLTEARELCNERRPGAWGQFCKQQLDCSRRHADRLIASHEAIGVLIDAGKTNLPATESVCRELVRLENEALQVAGWDLVLMFHDRPTASDVRKTLKKDTRFAAAFPETEAMPKGTEDALRKRLQDAIEKAGLSDSQKRRLMQKPLKELVSQNDEAA